MRYEIECTDTERRSRRRILAWAAPVFGLLFLAAPTVAAATSDPTALEVALLAAGLPSFAWLFLTVAMTERPPLVPLAAMTVIAVALTLTAESSFAVMFIYAASAAGVRLSGRAAAIAVAALTAVASATLALTDPQTSVFWGYSTAVAGTGTLWLLIGGLLRTNRELRDARAELADRAVAEERLRLARDMHDVVGHELSLIALKADLAGRLLPGRVDDAMSEVEDIGTQARGALTQVRQVVEGYRRPTLAGELAGVRFGLESAGVELHVDGSMAELDPGVEAVLAWAVREGATNVIRHSGARHMEITVAPGRERIWLEIADDGRGPAEDAARSAGHGLAGLRERVEAIGGTLDAAGEPGGGFRLRVSVPSGRSAVTA
jgi:two-component system, NarL family, sensor histidine kinase DesK